MTAESLTESARAFADAKQPLLGQIDARAAARCRELLNEMLAAANAGDAAQVKRFAERINSNLQDELAWQLHRERHVQDRLRK